mgnify:CR=1 FL=1
MATATSARRVASSQGRRAVSKPTSAPTSARIKPRGLYGLYKGKMSLNGTSNEVFHLGYRE